MCIQLDRCANLLRLSLEGFRQREEPLLRSLRPQRLVRSVLANLECLQPPILAEGFYQCRQPLAPVTVTSLSKQATARIDLIVVSLFYLQNIQFFEWSRGESNP